MGNPVVLITGSSSGIGHSLSLEFASRGCNVYATARKPESIEHLNEKGINTLRLDVTNKKSIDDCVRTIINESGKIDILINNAGYALIGPVAELDIDDFRKQFETNLHGQVMAIQSVFPYMADAGDGKIVNICSVSGILASPFAGAYCASKSAFIALSDSMRLEMAPFNIKVITINPGGIKSNFSNAASAGLEKYSSENSRYKRFSENIKERASSSQENATPVEIFSRKTVSKILSAKNSTIINIGEKSKLMPFIKRFLPFRTRDTLLKKKYNLKK